MEESATVAVNSPKEASRHLSWTVLSRVRAIPLQNVEELQVSLYDHILSVVPVRATIIAILHVLLLLVRLKPRRVTKHNHRLTREQG